MEITIIRVLYDEPNLLGLHKMFNENSVEFIVQNFNVFDTTILTKSDFIYIDSPYYPIDKKSFTRYTENDFGMTQHDELRQLCEKIDKKKCTFLLSNSCVEWTIENYKPWNMEEIMCKRSIHSKKPSTTALEILVSNDKCFKK